MTSATQNTVCLDASVAVKLVLPEEDSDAAASLWQMWEREEMRVIAPSLITWEIANAIRKTIRRGRLPLEAAQGIYTTFLELPIIFSAYDRLPLVAWQDYVIGFDLCVTPYDATYLVTAKNAECELWTADERLLRTVGDELPWLRSLSEIGNS
ncbi:MAG: type II toxin-antitoxin system VapC family toxin [Armatimonadota bacterium]